MDQELQASVTEELLSDPGIEAGQITVTASGGAVKLSGEVASLPARLAARRSAMRVPGVKAIADEMTVRSPDPTG
jgi:osmotically-inducible protein OsmY